jgi:hypothetical protein
MRCSFSVVMCRQSEAFRTAGVCGGYRQSRPAGPGGPWDDQSDDAVRTGTARSLSMIALAMVATLGLLYIVSQFLREIRSE